MITLMGTYYTINEVAKTLRTSRSTVIKYILNKELNAIKIGSRYLVTEEDFVTFIQNSRTCK